MALISESGFDIFVEKINGVEVCSNEDGTYDFFIATLSKDRKGIRADSFQSLIAKNVNDLSVALDKTIPLSIAFTGKWVVSRLIRTSEADTPQNLLSKVLPNANQADFYIQRYTIDESNAFVSLIRKDAFDSFINQCKQDGFNIVNCLLGPFALQAALPLFHAYAESRINEDINTSKYLLTIEKNKIRSVLPSKNSDNKIFDLSGIECQSLQLISFAAAFAYFLPSSDISFDIPQINTALSEYSFKTKFRKTAILYSFAAFGLLLINFIIFFYFNDQNKAIQQQVSMNATAITMVDNLKKQITDRQDFFSKNGITASTRSSFYADRIAASLPSSLYLTQLNVNPAKTDEETKKISYATSEIRIKGIAKYSMEVNEWIKELKKMSWIKDAILINYQQESSGSTGIFDIELKLK